jgi:hypothetical protein
MQLPCLDFSIIKMDKNRMDGIDGIPFTLEKFRESADDKNE